MEPIEPMEPMEPNKKSWYVYLLQEVGGTRTYVGATIDPNRRLRQHNGELSGGASATRGAQWRRMYLIKGFPCEGAALQFEWSWKNASKKMKGKTAMDRRNAALKHIMALEKPTKKAIPYKDYLEPLVVINEEEKKEKEKEEKKEEKKEEEKQVIYNPLPEQDTSQQPSQ